MSVQTDSLFRPTVYRLPASRLIGVVMLCFVACALAFGSSLLVSVFLSDVSDQTAQSSTAPGAPPGSARDTSMLKRWAAAPLSELSGGALHVPNQPAGALVQGNDELRGGILFLVAGTMTLLCISLFQSFLYALRQPALVQAPRPIERSSELVPAVRSGTDAEHQAKCRQLFSSVTVMWARAETAVFDLDESLPLRALLFKELKQISQRLALDSNVSGTTSNALTASHGQSFWRVLSQRLNQCNRDLKRVCAVAEAASAGFGSRSSEPRIPKTRDEACFILGASRDAEPETLLRLVKALRQCWHPDLAQTEQDRTYRDARLKQINAAHDLITGKRAEG